MDGYCWYGINKKGPGHPSKWVENILDDAMATADSVDEKETISEPGNDIVTLREALRVSHEYQIGNQGATSCRRQKEIPIEGECQCTRPTTDVITDGYFGSS